MRMRVWNAYASNNSGSYTIVGRMPSVEVAEHVARALRELIDAHTQWRDAWDDTTSLEESPLAQFCKREGLPWSEGDGGWDSWPEHSDDNRPRVAVSGSQIVVHHPYTVTLPPTFGALFYQRGGRVEHEADHAHHAIVVTAGFYWGWSEEQREAQTREMPTLIEALIGPGGIARQTNQHNLPPAWRQSTKGSGEYPFTLGIVFDDLIAGIAALRVQAEAHGAELALRLAEAPSKDDPFTHLRPSVPAVPRFDLLVTELGDDLEAQTRAVTEALDTYEDHARAQLESPLPITLARARFEDDARSLAATLERAGATTALRRNDG